MREMWDGDKRDRESLCFPVSDGRVQGSGRRGTCRPLPGASLDPTWRECPMRRERGGGVTTCRSRRICRGTSGGMCNRSYEGSAITCVHHRSRDPFSVWVRGSLPWSLVPGAVTAEQQLCNHVLLSWALSVPGRVALESYKMDCY